jgi:hypothetical protein
LSKIAIDQTIFLLIVNYTAYRYRFSRSLKDELDAEFQRSMRLLTDGKLDEARFILEDLPITQRSERALQSGDGLTASSMNWILQLTH